MQCTDNNGENQKIIRGRFIIQEIIDTQSNQNSNSDSDSDSSPFRYADVFIDTFQPKKRRNSQNNSKFKLNSIKESQISNSQFLVYDHERKSYVDINEVFQKYEFKIPIQHNITKSKRLLSLIIENQEDELIIDCKDSSNNNNNKDSYTGILKKNEVKRIESISNLAEHRALNDFERKESLQTSNTNNNINSNSNNNNNERKLKSPSKRFLSMNDKKNQLIEQRVISYLIESQHFNECSIASCQFSLCGNNNNHNNNNCNVELVVV